MKINFAILNDPFSGVSTYKKDGREQGLELEVPWMVRLLQTPESWQIFCHFYVSKSHGDLFFRTKVAGHKKNTTDNRMRFETMLNALHSSGINKKYHHNERHSC